MSVFSEAVRAALHAALVVLAMCGCHQPLEAPAVAGSSKSTAQQKPEGQAGSAHAPDVRRDSDGERRADLASELNEALQQRATLGVERARVAALVESHQQAGEERLARFQEQLRLLDEQDANAAARDRFAERARNELESTLLLDQEYMAQLDDLDARIAASDAHVASLRSRLAE